MKKIITLITLAMLVGGISSAQNDTRATLKERKMEQKAAVKELEAKVSKVAKKEAKKLKKEGWTTAPGQIPLEKQLDKSYRMYYEYEESGLPKYIIGDAMSPGKTYDAAKMQALELAKNNLAGQIETEITSLTESTVGNEQMSQTDAESIVSTVRASKSLIAQKLGRVITVMECYRNTTDKAVEVRVTIAYNSKLAIESAKTVIKQELEKKGEKLQDELDSIMKEYE